MAAAGQYYGDQVNVAAINGRDFAGVKLAATTQGGEVIIRDGRIEVHASEPGDSAVKY